MTPLLSLVRLHTSIARGLDLLRPLLLAGTRIFVSWQFLKAGWLKLTNWDVTLELFRSEYQVPILSPGVAAVFGTFGELFFPVLLILGLFTRLGALGLFAVNLMAVVSYWHVLGSGMRPHWRSTRCGDTCWPSSPSWAPAGFRSTDCSKNVRREPPDY
jgi:uncharacterized membrane protein YphA (DoxX/SURF4 family)